MARKPDQAGKKTREGIRQGRPLTFKQALARIGKTPQDRCRWLLNFAALDLDAVPPKRWGTLTWEVAAFTSKGKWESHHSFGLPELLVRAAQANFRELFEGIKTQGQGVLVCPDEQFNVRMVNGRLRINLQAAEAHHGSFYRTLREAQSWLRACLRCGTFFVAERGQKFCGSKCRQTVQTRRFQEKLGEEGFRDKRAEYYFTKLEKDNPGMKLKPKRYKPRTKPPLEAD